jgi:hypothetical protein
LKSIDSYQAVKDGTADYDAGMASVPPARNRTGKRRIPMRFCCGGCDERNVGRRSHGKRRASMAL